jgi:hypothetical protein
MFENVFSRRKGYTPPPVQGKPEELSDHARTRLWDVFYIEIFQKNREGVDLHPHLEAFFLVIWTELDHQPIDQYLGSWEFLKSIRERFLSGVWHFSFDIFEAIFEDSENLMRDGGEVAFRLRDALERENQAYTFVGGRFVERMMPHEVQSVETALQTTIEGVRVHLTSALRKLSDRDKPDFRDSIKESISAVESACHYVTNQKKSTLEAALRILDNRKPWPPGFKDSLAKLYAWTGEEDGVRHPMMEASDLERGDAQFMLVTCSAVVNYLITR